MTDNLDLEQALSALDSYGYEKKQSADLSQARNKQQMKKYLYSLDYSIRRMQTLQEAVNEIVNEEQHKLVLKENIQTIKTKMINISRQYNITYDDILTILAK
ncbi:MAG: hypothetical protein ACPGUD_06745 [Parashewanella sp.]